MVGLSALAPVLKFALERGKTVISKKVGASAGGVALIASGQTEAGWAAIAYAVLQAIVDVSKYFIDVRYGDGGESD